MTPDYFNFSINRATVNGKFDVLNDIKKLTDRGVDVWSAIGYCCEKVKEEINELKPLERYYEGR